MDVNEYALKVQPATKSLELVIRKAVWLGKGKAPTVATHAALAPAPAETTLPGPGAAIPEAAKEEAAPDLDRVCETEATSPASSSSTEDVTARALPLAASPEPVSPAAEALAGEERGEEIAFAFGDRRWRVRGLAKCTSFDALRVNVLVAREGAGFHVDTLDLYAARHRRAFVQEAAAELGLEEQAVKRDLGQVLLRLEALQEEQIRRALEPKEKEAALSDAEQAEALDLLRDPRLLERILADFTRSGVVGEETNKLVGYLAAVSRKLEEPLAVVIQSSSAAGKSSLMEAVLAFVPEEERVQYSALTGQSLFYLGEQDLRHKILAIVEEEGAERAAYALKLLQSEGRLTIASTGKDPQTGRLVTHEYRVEGPVMIFLTTTAIEVDEELLNRCLVLTVDEDREQTRAIHRLQRERQTLEGLLLRQERDEILRVHRNAQRLLRPLLVANPFARELTFLDHRTRTRRDHMKYLTLIRAIALLHQYQRPVRTVQHHGRPVRYIEVTKDDIATANRLAHEVLGRSLDELPPQTRRLLGLVAEMVAKRCAELGLDRADYRFTRREVREATGWGSTQTKLHLARLEELEYLLVHRGSRGQGFVYELLFDAAADPGSTFLPGLLDVEKLPERGYDGEWSGPEGSWSAPGRPLAGPGSGGGRGGEIDATTRRSDGKRTDGAPSPENALPGSASAPLSYVPAALPIAAAATSRGR
jgi:hypothetical protein